MGHLPLNPNRRSEILDEISELIGEELMLRLWKENAGTDFYFSAKPSKRLVELVGFDAARKLCDHFSSHLIGDDGELRSTKVGIRLEFPIFRDVEREEQTQIIITEKSAREAALLLGISKRTVHRRRSKVRQLKKRKP